ncbi:MAG: MerR family transcriptional regulator [Lachnospiraceae bacterium]|nr:MerR family transcriptional regulator [Lachnospiraceae bacterium]
MEKVRYIISDAAQMIDVESHVLRYWEEELDLKVPRNELGHRYYTEENIEQFRKIKALKEKGYQLKAIKMLLQEDKPFVESEEKEESAKQKIHIVPKEKAPVAQDQEEKVQSLVTQSQIVQARAEEKMEQFQNLMTDIVKKAIEENNQALGISVGEHVGEKVLKEMNYLMREQEEMAEEHYRKLDEAIRQHYKSRKLFQKSKKDKSLQPKTI